MDIISVVSTTHSFLYMLEFPAMFRFFSSLDLNISNQLPCTVAQNTAKFFSFDRWLFLHLY